MKAIIYNEYGAPEVLHIKEIEKPIPKDNEILIKVMATSVHRGDTRMRSLNIPGPKWQIFAARLFLGFKKPKRSILGMELAGKIVEVGKSVTKFKVGDKVFADTFNVGFGGYAEFKCMAEDDAIAIMPSNMTYEQAAVIPSGGISTLGSLKQANITQGQKVLIYGASGSVGTFAIQIAKAFGGITTGVCSTENLDFIKEIGVDNVLDYTKEDFSKLNEKYDVIFDAVDLYKGDYKKALVENGIFLSVGKATDKIKKKDHRILLHELKELIESGKLQAVVDKTYKMEDVVDAHHYVDKGHKKGNIALIIGKD